MKHLVLAFGIVLLSVGCQQPAKEPVVKAPNDDQLFQRRVECGKFLTHIEGSVTGPDFTHHTKGVSPLNPVVFYSPKLNTCLLISRSLLSGKTDAAQKFTVFSEVIDLLTGRTVEAHEFDLSNPEEKKASNDFEEDVLRRY